MFSVKKEKKKANVFKKLKMVFMFTNLENANIQDSSWLFKENKFMFLFYFIFWEKGVFIRFMFSIIIKRYEK